MKKTNRILLIAALGAALLLVLGGCAAKQETKPTAAETTAAAEIPAVTQAPAAESAASTEQLQKQTRVGYYLDTVVTLTAYTDRPELLDQALETCGELEAMLSRTIEGSDVWKINHAEGKTVTVSPETAEILRTALEVSQLSDGAFDITVAPVSVLWDFKTGDNIVPDAETIAKAAALVDYRKIRIDGNDVTLPAGMMIDLGGIAKGYIADAVKEKLERQGIQSAILSFGGNIVAIGLKPGGAEWRVGIQDIDKPTGTTMLVSLNFGGSTVTSGIYERGFEKDGVYYHHILSAADGWPVQNELASVTIFSESSMWGDALATAAFALGTEKGAALIEGIDGTEALFIDRNRNVSGTSGVARYMAEGEKYTVIPKTTQAPAETETPVPTEAAAGDPDKLVLLVQVRETDPAPGYILVQGEKIIGFLALPTEGEKIQPIVQHSSDGSVWRNVIRMTPEGFQVTEADCEGHDCMLEGEVTLSNMKDRLLWNMVICAPHQLMLSLCTPAEAAEISGQWLRNY